MKISRRTFFGLSGAAAVVATGCGDKASLSDAETDGAARTDGGDPPPFPDEDFEFIPGNGDGTADGGVETDAGNAAADGGAADGGAAGGGAADGGAAGGGAADGGAAGGGADLALGSIPRNSAAFPIRVMAGDVLPNRAMVWTRYTGDRELVLRVVEMRNGRPVRLAFEEQVRPTRAGFVHVDVPRLRPGAEHAYAFLERGGTRFVGRSRLGRFRTAIADDAQAVLTFGGASCNNLRGAPFPAYSHAARSTLDFFIHCGDHVYADTAETLPEYQSIYNRYWPVRGLAAVHSSTGLYCIWDDHEVDNDWSRDDRDVSSARLEAAREAFFRNRAFRRNPTHPNRLWRSFRWGRTAEIFILDVRSERLARTRLTSSGAANPDAQYISRTQLNWIKAQLSASQAVFKFVVTSKPITGRLADDTRRVDYWEGYSHQREELLQHIASNNIPGIWFLSGDVHYGAIMRVEATGPYARWREIYMGPGGSGDPDPSRNRCEPRGQSDAFINEHNFARFRADPFAKTLEIAFVNAAGIVVCSKQYRA